MWNICKPFFRLRFTFFTIIKHFIHRVIYVIYGMTYHIIIKNDAFLYLPTAVTIFQKNGKICGWKGCKNIFREKLILNITTRGRIAEETRRTYVNMFPWDAAGDTISIKKLFSVRQPFTQWSLSLRNRNLLITLFYQNTESAAILLSCIASAILIPNPCNFR